MGKKSLFDVYLKKFQEFYFTYRALPSFSQCMEIIGVQSKSAVHRFFQQMVDRGYLEKRQGVYYPGDRLVALPFFESVRAGLPTDSASEDVETMHIENYLIDDPQHTILIKVKGDSMKDAGLNGGDVVIVDTTRRATRGDIVIASVDYEYTVKFLEQDGSGQVVLLPANSDYQPIYPQGELSITGVVIGSFRRY